MGNVVRSTYTEHRVPDNQRGATKTVSMIQQEKISYTTEVNYAGR